MVARRRVEWTPDARNALEAVLASIARESPGAARRFLEQVLAMAQSLSDFAERGRVVPERADPTIREVFVRRYRMMYRVTADSAQILTFIHGARDFDRQ